MGDRFHSYPETLDSPALNAVAVTPGPAELEHNTRAIYVGGAGNLVVTMGGGQTVTFTAVPAGTVLPLRASHILAGGTATSILALW